MTLKDYLTKHKLSPGEFGKLIGRARQSVHRYIHGERFPDRATLEQIAQITGGKVTANDFVGMSHSGTLTRASRNGSAQGMNP